MMFVILEKSRHRPELIKVATTAWSAVIKLAYLATAKIAEFANDEISAD